MHGPQNVDRVCLIYEGVKLRTRGRLAWSPSPLFTAPIYSFLIYFFFYLTLFKSAAKKTISRY